MTDEQATQIVAENVVRLAAKRGMSCRALARATGDTAMRISTIMRGAHEPKIGVLTRIAAALDTTVDYLVSHVEVIEKVDSVA